MQTDVQKNNENVTPNSDVLEVLKKYFPSCFDKPETDENGNIIKEHFDTEKLAELINSDKVDIKKEGFSLNFLGKSYAHYQSNLDSETIIVPDENNKNIESDNVYIVGDNLDALQHLKYSYQEKIKCIYIDPPYNTGKDDFVYNDKFGFTSEELIKKLDISEDEAERIVGMGGKCTHSAWLTFMYPRLALAHDLLREDGVIFISIDDNEQSNLKMLCDTLIFGEGNFVGELIIETATDNNPSQINTEHEYMLCYAKNKALLKNWTRKSEAAEKINAQYKKLKEKESDISIIQEKLRKWIKDNTDELKLKQVAHYNNVDKDGVYSSSSNSSNPHPGGYMFDIPHPVTHKNCPKPENGWRWAEKTFWEADAAGQVEWGTDHTTQPHIKKRIETAMDLLKSIIYEDNRASTKLVADLFNGKKVFDNPKPLSVLYRIMDFVTEDGDIILDFFSGSGTTAHSIMQLNADKGNGTRKFIAVQLPEDLDLNLKNAKSNGRKLVQNAIDICDELNEPHILSVIGQERIRRAAIKIKEQNLETKTDLSFKTYFLKDMPQNTIDKIKIFDPSGIGFADGDIIKTLGEEALLQTWQIKDGFGFNVQAKEVDLAGYKAYLLDDPKIGKYLYLLTGIEEKSIKELIRQIESFELTVDKIFKYGYSFDFNSSTSLDTNLKTLKNRNPIEPITRY